MKFRTEIDIVPFEVKIGHENHLLTLGSCFAEHIGARLAAAKFRTATNPTGILFNPLSVAAAIGSYTSAAPIGPKELHFDGQVWFHYGFHGDFSDPDPLCALEQMNAARQAGAEALRSADRVLLTFGTAWIFERDREVVANCHKQPASRFTRRRLSVEEIVGVFDRLLRGALADKEVILTVSPVRHLADGLQGNAASKAVLRLAIEALCEKHANAHYFPAFELLNDDLRDYRFYADDLVHPAPQAIAYIWEKFTAAALTEQARLLLPDIESIVAAATHRPRNPRSEAHKALCRKQLARIAELPRLDFRVEAEYFRRCIEINS